MMPVSKSLEQKLWENIFLREKIYFNKFTIAVQQISNKKTSYSVFCSYPEWILNI